MIRRLISRAVAPIDAWMLCVALVLLALGLTVLHSAAGEESTKVLDQLRNIAVALALLGVAANVPPRLLQRFALPAYVVGVCLLFAVAAYGETSHGAKRWLYIGVTRIQPSELMKIAMPLMLAWFFQRKEGNLRLFDFALAAVLLIVPVALIARQPDLGTALLISISGFYVLFLAGLSWRVLLALACAGAVSLPLVWSVLRDYQRQRVLTLLDPSQDPLGAGYHIIQSTIALGSGGITGKGWLNGTQAHLDFLPERTTDFIFAVYGEEFGLIGSFALLALILLLVFRGMAIAASADTPFARLAAGGLALTWFTYAFVNMGMVSGILPVVGVPLPFISYGGTALVTILLGVGIVMSVNYHKQRVQG